MYLPLCVQCTVLVWMPLCIELNNKNKKENRMKKLILSAALVGVLTGCSDTKDELKGELKDAKELKKVLLEIQDIKEKESETNRKLINALDLSEKASIYVVQAQQLGASISLYSIMENKLPKKVEDLIPEYMNKVPKPPVEFSSIWKVDSDTERPFIEYPINSSPFSIELCETIKEYGYSDKVTCDIENSIAKITVL